MLEFILFVLFVTIFALVYAWENALQREACLKKKLEEYAPSKL